MTTDYSMKSPNRCSIMLVLGASCSSAMQTEHPLCVRAEMTLRHIKPSMMAEIMMDVWPSACSWWRGAQVDCPVGIAPAWTVMGDDAARTLFINGDASDVVSLITLARRLDVSEASKAK